MGVRRSLRSIDLPAGMVRTPDGHLRYTSPKALRGKYVHRVRIEDLIVQTPWSVRIMLPWPYEVHHMDYKKDNNAPHNLLMVSEALHSAMTSDNRLRCKYGKFRPKWADPPPTWVLFGDELEEIPF